jgi:glycosyltransferase involved in cell wall biosynthesis
VKGTALRILLLTQWFDPEPTFKGLVFARELQALGHEVEVITGFPNYPGGNLYPGFRQKWLSRSVIDGVSVTRVPLYPSHSGSAIKRIFNYVSFMLSSCLYGVFGAKRADIIYVYHPPITAGLSAAVIGFFRRTPFVIDVQDLWPDTLRSTGMISNERALALAGKVCNWTYRRAKHVVVLSPGFRKILIERGIPAERLSVIYNWCDEQALATDNATSVDTSYLDGHFNVVFAGNIGKAQALEAVIRAAQIVWERDKAVRFVFVGAGVEVESLKVLAAQLGVQNLRFVPRVPMSEVGAILSRADVLLVHLKDDPLFAITIPSKTQAYLAVGKPILMGVRGDAADLVTQAQAGMTVTPENDEAIADAVLRMASLPAAERRQMAENSVKFYHDHLSLKIGSRKFSDLFQRLLCRNLND